MKRLFDGLVETEWLRALSLLLVAIYLVPEGAHVFEMFTKMTLAPPDYMTVQRIYDGWALFGIVIVAALVSTLALTIANRRQPLDRWLSLAAFACLAATQVIFWSLIFPMNVLTLAA